jgi:hypothetical protein
MHHNERSNTTNFCINSAANIMAHINNAINLNDSSEASQRRQTFHARSFGNSGTPYMDDDDVSLDKNDILRTYSVKFCFFGKIFRNK